MLLALTLTRLDGRAIFEVANAGGEKPPAAEFVIPVRFVEAFLEIRLFAFDRNNPIGRHFNWWEAVEWSDVVCKCE